MVRGTAGYCSDTLYMAIVTRIVQGAPGVGVANGRVGICTGDVELRRGGGEEERWRRLRLKGWAMRSRRRSMNRQRENGLRGRRRRTRVQDKKGS